MPCAAAALRCILILRHPRDRNGTSLTLLLTRNGPSHRTAEQPVCSNQRQVMLLQLNPFRKGKEESLDEVRQWGTDTDSQSPLRWGKRREGNPGKRHLKVDLHGVILKEKVVIKVLLRAFVLAYRKGLRLFWEMPNHRRKKANFLPFNYFPLERNRGAFPPENMHAVQTLPARRRTLRYTYARAQVQIFPPDAA